MRLGTFSHGLISLPAARALVPTLARRPMVWPPLEWLYRAHQVADTLQRNRAPVPGWLADATALETLAKAVRRPRRKADDQADDQANKKQRAQVAHHLIGKRVRFEHPETGDDHHGKVGAVGGLGVTVHGEADSGVHKLHHGHYSAAPKDPPEDLPARGPRGPLAGVGSPDADPGDSGAPGTPGRRHQLLRGAWRHLGLRGRAELRVVAAAAILAHQLHRVTPDAEEETVFQAVAHLRPDQVQVEKGILHLGPYKMPAPPALRRALAELAKTAGGSGERLFSYRSPAGELLNLTAGRLHRYQARGR